MIFTFSKNLLNLFCRNFSLQRAPGLTHSNSLMEIEPCYLPLKRKADSLALHSPSKKSRPTPPCMNTADVTEVPDRTRTIPGPSTAYERLTEFQQIKSPEMGLSEESKLLIKEFTESQTIVDKFFAVSGGKPYPAYKLLIPSLEKMNALSKIRNSNDPDWISKYSEEYFRWGRMKMKIEMDQLLQDTYKSYQNLVELASQLSRNSGTPNKQIFKDIDK